MGDITQRAVAGQLQGPPRHRMEKVVKAFYHRDARLVGGLCDAGSFSPVAGERLFGEHRFARRHRGEIPRCVK